MADAQDETVASVSTGFSFEQVSTQGGALAQSIVDKRLALEESHFSQRMLRQQQLLEISEARVRELEDENKKLISRLAAADAQKSKHEEEATLLQLNLQRARDELSEFKEKLAETRDAGVIEVASASAMHAREMREQQQAAGARRPQLRQRGTQRSLGRRVRRS